MILKLKIYRFYSCIKISKQNIIKKYLLTLLLLKNILDNILKNSKNRQNTIRDIGERWRDIYALLKKRRGCFQNDKSRFLNCIMSMKKIRNRFHKYWGFQGELLESILKKPFKKLSPISLLGE